MFSTLRGRLLALFFLVALIPSLGLTFAVTQYLAKSLSALQNPETERALGQSLELIRQGIERLDRTVTKVAAPAINAVVHRSRRNSAIYKNGAVKTSHVTS